MTVVSFENGMIQVDATVVAKGLGLTPDALRAGLRDTTVTSRCEKGEGEDAGRYRVTFYSSTRRMRLIVTADGTVLQQTSAAYSRPKAV